MSETTQAPACRDCRFWEPAKSVPDVGTCRRYAPQPGEHSPRSHYWPESAPDAWCGEFKLRDPIGAFERAVAASERECRTRERAAWDASAHYGYKPSPEPSGYNIPRTQGEMDAERDRRYPVERKGERP